MKTFALKFFLILGILLAILVGFLFFVPNPLVQSSMLAALPDKNAHLATLPSPKVVLLGGSNVSFGFDTRRIQDSLDMPVYNMGMVGGVGLDYMMRQTIPYINDGDIVVLIPEYTNFYSAMYYGKRYLAALLFDVAPETIKDVPFAQWKSLLPSVGKYAGSKVIGLPVFIKQYMNKQPAMKGLHAKDCFNAYGDNDKHWELEPRTVIVESYNKAHEELTDYSLSGVKELVAAVEARGARALLLPPSYQHSSYENQRSIIGNISAALEAQGTPFIAPTERYRFEDKHFFDTNYHLNKGGIDIRTALVIEDLRKQLGKGN